MSAAALKERLRGDLKSAMQAKAAAEVRVLRTLIAALDNAEAVPTEIQGYVSREFGDPSGEVARRELGRAEIDAVIAAEIESRLAAATDYDRHQRPDESARLRDEAAVIARYRTT
jgi:uncharacterized protein YqeY